MQMQPISPLGPLVVGAKEARPDNSGKSIDSILSSLIGTEATAAGTADKPVGKNANLAPQPNSPENAAIGGTDPPLEAEITTLAIHAAVDRLSELDSSKIAALAEFEDAEEILDVAATPSAVIAPEKQQADSNPVSSPQPAIAAFLSEEQPEITDTTPQKILTSLNYEKGQDTRIQNITAPQTQTLQTQNAIPQEGEKKIAAAAISQTEATISQDKNSVSLVPLKTEITDVEVNLLKVRGKVPQPFAQSLASSTIELRFPELTRNLTDISRLENTAQTGQAGASLIDFQFAEIIGRSSAQALETPANLIPLRQRNNWAAAMDEAAAAPGGTKPTAETTILKIFEELMTGDKTGNKDANLFQTSHSNFYSTPASTAAGEAAADFGANMFTGQATSTLSATSSDDSAVKLPSGIVVAENTVVNHVVKHISFFTLHEGSGISIKMHPEELGNLHIRLVSEENGIKAHIQVQSQQVQDILEKHLFRLKEGFQQQGINLHDIQVSVNSGKNSGPDFFNHQFNSQYQPQTSNTVATNESQENVIEETLVIPTQPEGLISLRI